MLRRKGIDLSGFTEEQLLNADDCYFFPNVVGPIYPGSTTLFRVRPNGLDPLSTIKDLWTLEWPEARARSGRCRRGSTTPTGRPRTGASSPTRTTPTWSTSSPACSRAAAGLRLNPRQESNVLHMHRVIDRYLSA